MFSKDHLFVLVNSFSLIHCVILIGAGPGRQGVESICRW